MSPCSLLVLYRYIEKSIYRIVDIDILYQIDRLSTYRFVRYIDGFFDLSYRVSAVTMIIRVERYKLLFPSLIASDYYNSLTDFCKVS